jgi:transposase
VKRFRCLNVECPKITFVERLPDLLPFHAQRTNRLTVVLRELGFALGGEAGARITGILQMHWSANTLLRIMRNTVLDEYPPPRVLGVDDWAIRKGRTYGTILVDLERHCPIDLLPDREAQTLADWLKAHPGIEIVSRDRAGAYAAGIRQGTPDAIQVADRWHLIKNLWDALAESYDCHHRLLKQITVEARSSPSSKEPVDCPSSPSSPTSDAPRKAKRQPTAQEIARQQRREYWLTKFQQVHTLRDQGMTINAITRETGLHKNTVRKYCRLPELPKKTAPKPGPRLIDPYRGYLRKRIKESNPSINKLWSEIQKRGFTGGHTTVYHCVAQLRHEMGIPPLKGRQKSAAQKRTSSLTARQLASLVLCLPDDLSDAQRQLISRACQLHPDIQQATQQASAFVAMLRSRDPSALDLWLQAVISSDIPSLKKFVSGIQKDYTAVRAAFILPWSNGQVEGQVNRLKLIKRQMYGRARFDLLRLRVLYPT